MEHPRKDPGKIVHSQMYNRPFAHSVPLQFQIGELLGLPGQRNEGNTGVEDHYEEDSVSDDQVGHVIGAPDLQLVQLREAAEGQVLQVVSNQRDPQEPGALKACQPVAGARQPLDPVSHFLEVVQNYEHRYAHGEGSNPVVLGLPQEVHVSVQVQVSGGRVLCACQGKIVRIGDTELGVETVELWDYKLCIGEVPSHSTNSRKVLVVVGLVVMVVGGVVDKPEH